MFGIFFKLIFSIIFLINLVIIDGVKYEFVFDNENIYQPCSDIAGNKGLSDVFDLSDFIMEYNEGKINIGGKTTNVWNVMPTDNIQLHADLFKFQRGTWQPTMVTLHVKDFCEDQYKEDVIWYNIWSKYIFEEDRVCINEYQKTYRYTSVEMDNHVNLPNNMEGLHKVRITLEAFEENGKKNPSSICFEIVGDIVKLKN